MREEKDYDVTLTVRVSTRISFADMERQTPITESDAIENAISATFAWNLFESEGFSIAYPIDGEAVEIT